MNLDYPDNRKDFYRSIPKFGERMKPESKKCLHCGTEIIRHKHCTDGAWKQKQFCTDKCRRARYRKGYDTSIRLSPVIDQFLRGAA